jgi:hypothetical protein
MRNSDELNPAAVKACLMYGASKSTHRVDDVVSGRITPICRLLAPLVADAASPLNWLISDEMSTLKESTLSPDGTVAEPPAAADERDADDAAAELGAAAAELDELDELDELQAAAVTATTAATIATDPRRLTRRNVSAPCRPECEPFSGLLPSLIPCPSTLMHPDESTRDTIQPVCPVREC